MFKCMYMLLDKVHRMELLLTMDFAFPDALYLTAFPMQ